MSIKHGRCRPSNLKLTTPYVYPIPLYQTLFASRSWTPLPPWSLCCYHRVSGRPHRLRIILIKFIKFTNNLNMHSRLRPLTRTILYYNSPSPINSMMPCQLIGWHQQSIIGCGRPGLQVSQCPQLQSTHRKSRQSTPHHSLSDPARSTQQSGFTFNGRLPA